MSTLRALLVLTADLTRRFLREGIVLRSLVFPALLSLLAVVGTVAVVLFVRPAPIVALSPDQAVPELVGAIEDHGYEAVLTPTPGELVTTGAAALGTDGVTLWIGAGGHPPLVLEELVRRHLNTAWVPHQPRAARARRIEEAETPTHLARFIGALFAFYGVVFGAGSVARDRDQGTLNAELAMGIPTWVHGAARWLAGSIILSVFFLVSVGFLHAFLGLQGALGVAVQGAAASATATALGLIAIGRAGLDRGFAGPMSAGLVVVVSLLSFGIARHDIGQYLPIASLAVGDANHPAPIVLSCVLGAIATWVFSRRTAVM